MEIQGVATNRNDVFPYSGIRILGIMQLILGMVVFLLGVLDLALTITSHDDMVALYGDEYDSIVTMTVASSPLWCGLWFGITGSLGTCISRQRAHSLHFLKMAFLVLNMLCACLFAPVCGVLAGLITVSRHTLDPTNLQWLLSLLITFMAGLEIAVSVVSASVACCCAPLKTTQVHVIVNPPGGGDLGANIPPPGASSLQVPSKRGASNYDAQSAINNRSEADDAATEKRDQDESFENEADNGDVRKAAYDGFADSGGYPKLKKWALPGW